MAAVPNTGRTRTPQWPRGLDGLALVGDDPPPKRPASMSRQPWNALVERCRMTRPPRVPGRGSRSEAAVLGSQHRLRSESTRRVPTVSASCASTATAISTGLIRHRTEHAGGMIPAPRRSLASPIWLQADRNATCCGKSSRAPNYSLTVESGLRRAMPSVTNLPVLADR